MNAMGTRYKVLHRQTSKGPVQTPSWTVLLTITLCWYAKTENGVHGRTWWYSLPGLLISEEFWLLRQPQRVIKAWGGLIGVKLAALGSWLRHVQLGGKLRNGVCSTCQPDECSAAANGGYAAVGPATRWYLQSNKTCHDHLKAGGERVAAL